MKSSKITDSIEFNNKKIECEGNGDYNCIYIGGYRYQLCIKISNPKDNKKLACIMMNPSTTFPNETWENENWKTNLNLKENQKKTKGFDPTVKNVIKMAYSKGYSEINIFNLFPYIQPNSNIAFENFKNEQKTNVEFIKKLEENSKILIAWGNKSPKNKFLKKEYAKLKSEYLKIFKDKNVEPVMYEWNKKQESPYHPSQQVDNAYTKDKITGVIRKKQKGNHELGIIQQFIQSEEDFKPLKIINNGQDFRLACQTCDTLSQTP